MNPAKDTAYHNDTDSSQTVVSSEKNDLIDHIIQLQIVAKGKPNIIRNARVSFRWPFHEHISSPSHCRNKCKNTRSSKSTEGPSRGK
jgi:hypothetical protein